MENNPLKLVDNEIYFSKTKNKVYNNEFNTDLTNYLTTKEASKILGVSKARISQLVKKGELSVKYLTEEFNLGFNKEKYLFYAEEVDNYKNSKVKFNSKINELNLISKAFNSTDLTLDTEKEELKKRLEQLIFEMGKLSGLLSGKDEQLRQTQNLLAERAESLFEKDAKIKELEEKFKKENEEKEKLFIEIAFKNTPWWKKIFSSREKVEKEINKKIKECG